MYGFSSVVLVGNMVRGVELKRTANGAAVAHGTIAVNERKDGRASFFDITFWEKTAELAAARLGKGTPAVIAGSLSQECWTDSTGGRRSNVVVRCFRFFTMNSQGRKPDAYSEPADAPATVGDEALGAAEPEDEIPF